jgi:hypothetical protein
MDVIRSYFDSEIEKIKDKMFMFGYITGTIITGALTIMISEWLK